MYGLDLFSGIGGLTKALEPWVRPVAYCENDRFAQAVLLSRMADGLLPIAPIWDDVCSLVGEMVGKVEIIYGGFPCQDISVAGRGKGLEGERSRLVFEMLRLSKEIKPDFLFFENTPAIRTKGADVICNRLAELGYDCRWGLLSAYDVGAPHKRERWFLLAYSKSELLSKSGETRARRDGFNDDGLFKTKRFDTNNWNIEPNMDRVVDGVSKPVDRLHGLGNSVVPAQAREAFERLIGFKK